MLNKFLSEFFSSGQSLKSSVMGITGPLIRVLGERYNWTVKSAVLDAIYHLLDKVGVILKPFLPQLHPTFMKNLNDINRTVRLKSGYALSKLIPMNPKFDQVIAEIHNYLKNTEDAEVKETLLNTLRLCLASVGSKCQDETKRSLVTTLKSDAYVYNEDDLLRPVSCGALGALAAGLNEDDLNALLNDIFDSSKQADSDWHCLHANCMITSTLLQYNTARIHGKASEAKCLKFLGLCVGCDRVQVVKSAIRSVGFYLDFLLSSGMPIENDLVSVLAKALKNSSNDLKEMCLNLISVLSIKNSTPFAVPVMKSLLPLAMNGTREKEASVRFRGEVALVNLVHLRENEDLLKVC